MRWPWRRPVDAAKLHAELEGEWPVIEELLMHPVRGGPDTEATRRAVASFTNLTPVMGVALATALQAQFAILLLGVEEHAAICTDPDCARRSPEAMAAAVHDGYTQRASLVANMAELDEGLPG